MKRFVFAAAIVAGLGMTAAGSALAQGCGGAGGMCALPGAATGQQQAMPGMSMPGMPAQQAVPGAQQQQAAPGTGMTGGMCPCCRQMAMMQPQPGAQGGAGMGMGMMGQGGLRPMAPDGAGTGGDTGMGGTPRPPAGEHHPPAGTPPAQ